LEVGVGSVFGASMMPLTRMRTVTRVLRLVPMGVELAGFAPWVLLGDMVENV